MIILSKTKTMASISSDCVHEDDGSDYSHPNDETNDNEGKEKTYIDKHIEWVRTSLWPI